MIQKVMFVNPITELEETLNIDTSYCFDHHTNWLSETNKVKTFNDCVILLNDYISRLDCSKEYNGQRILMTSWLGYKMLLSSIMFHMLHLDNQLLYNYYLDKVIAIHCNNLYFEYCNPPKAPVVKYKRKSTKAKNKYIKYTSKDIFTGKEIYTYTNHVTGDTFDSDNPNLLIELNAKKVKKKKVNKTINMNNIVFNFNIKQDV